MRRTICDIKWTVILLAVFIFTACGNKNNPKQATLTSLKKLILTKNLTIPTRVDTLIVGGYGRVVADHNKNIYGIDYQNQRILEFDDQGHFVRQIGRKGAGPGEFKQIGQETVRGDTLYVNDATLRRLNIFHLPVASFVRSVTLPKDVKNIKNPGYPSSFLALDNGSIGVLYDNPMGGPKSGNQIVAEDHFYWIRTNPGIQKIPIPAFRGYKFFRIQREKFVALIPDPTGSHAIIKSHKNLLYFGRTDSLKIIAYQPDGSRVRTFQLNIPPMRVTAALKDSLLKRRGKIVKEYIHPSDLGNVFPVFRNFWIDDAGRVWVLLENPFNKQMPLIVFKPDGTPGWKTMIPKLLDIQCIRNHSVYGIWRDKDGMTSIVRYAIRFS